MFSFQISVLICNFRLLFFTHSNEESDMWLEVPLKAMILPRPSAFVPPIIMIITTIQYNTVDHHMCGIVIDLMLQD